MTPERDDAHWLRRAIAVGAQGTRTVRPNPRVGCVLVRDGQEIACGFHAIAGSAHAERVALAAAGERARGCTAYVTLEPCNHQGRTGPCTQALMAAGITRVVVGVADPHALAGGGADFLRAAGIPVTVGIEEAASRQLAEVFLVNVVSRRPFVQLKLAMTLDGRTAAADGSSRWITGPDSRLEVHKMRAEADAVLIGSGTALHDDPALDLRHLTKQAELPLRVVLDRRLRLPATHRLADTSRQATLLLVADPACLETPPAAALRAQGVMLQAVPAEPWLAAALRALHDRGVCRVLCEGGATLAAALLRANLVDRLDVFIAPKLLGSGAPLLAELGVGTISEAMPLRWDTVQRAGDDVWLTARLPDEHQ